MSDQPEGFWVGIDPDLTKSGVAIRTEKSKRWVFAKAVSNEDLIETIVFHCGKKAVIKLEAGWMNKKANHRGTRNQRVSDAISKKVGENHAVGKMIHAMLSKAGYLVLLVLPLKKGPLKVNGRWTKIGREYITKSSGIQGKMNDEVRDAIFLLGP